MADLQAEVLLGEFWDPGSGAVFAEEGDQQRFWKLTRKFAENLASISEGGKVRAVRIPPGKYGSLVAIDSADAACKRTARITGSLPRASAHAPPLPAALMTAHDAGISGRR